MGRENILEDAGNRSELYIQTDNNESLILKDNIVKYTLRASKNQKSNLLKGVLTLIITDSQNEDPHDLHATIVKIPFNNNLDISFPDRQYLGTWEGQIGGNSEFKEIFSSLRNISISKVDPKNYTVSGSGPTFILENESFQIINSKRKLKELLTREFPTITLEYSGNKGSKVIITGKINSLENFSGSISITDIDGINKKIGWFNFLKK